VTSSLAVFETGKLRHW